MHALCRNEAGARQPAPLLPVPPGRRRRGRPPAAACLSCLPHALNSLVRGEGMHAVSHGNARASPRCLTSPAAGRPTAVLPRRRPLACRLPCWRANGERWSSSLSAVASLTTPSILSHAVATTPEIVICAAILRCGPRRGDRGRDVHGTACFAGTHSRQAAARPRAHPRRPLPSCWCVCAG